MKNIILARFGVALVGVIVLLSPFRVRGGCVGSIAPGGPCSIGPGGGQSIGPGGGLSIGPGGGLSIGPGGGLSIGPGGGQSIGPGGGLSIGPGGGLSIGPQGGLSIGPGGGLSIGPGGGLSIGPGNQWRSVPGGGKWKPQIFESAMQDLSSGNVANAISVFQSLAGEGYSPALNIMGELYYKIEDFANSLTYYAAAAAQGDHVAQANIGNMYTLGQGVRTDLEMALDYYRLSAESGNTFSKDQLPYAEYRLADALLDGTGLPRDTKRAADLFRSSWSNGLKGGYAETTLGWMYLTGEYAPVPVDYLLSLIWSEKGALAGHPNAHSNMALHYFAGFKDSVPRDFEKMRDHLVKSAELFGAEHYWVVENIRQDGDEWLKFKHLAPGSYWRARELYVDAISTGDVRYIDRLRSLNP